MLRRFALLRSNGGCLPSKQQTYDIELISDSEFKFENIDGYSYALRHTLKTIGFLADFHPQTKVYSLEFFPEFEKPDYDKVIKPTILKSFAQSIAKRGFAIHYYIPDPAEKKHHARARMFYAWFEEMITEYRLDYTQHIFQIDAEEGDPDECYYWVFLIPNSFDLKDQFLQHVSQYIDSTWAKES